MNDGSTKLPLSDDELEAVVGGSSIGQGGVGRSGFMPDFGSMDIEQAMMMVQSQRSEMLDAAMQSQVQDVQQRNQDISDLNGGLAELRQLGTLLDGNEPISQDEANRMAASLDELLARFSVDPIDKDGNGEIAGKEVNDAIDTIKGLIDTAGNSQQMDMLRLQSLTDRRNEAFDVMSNFIKKMQEARSGIIGNMR